MFAKLNTTHGSKLLNNKTEKGILSKEFFFFLARGSTDIIHRNKGQIPKLGLSWFAMDILAAPSWKELFIHLHQPSNLSGRFPSRRRAANFESNLFPCQRDPRAMNTVTTMYKISLLVYTYMHTHIYIYASVVKKKKKKRFSQIESIFLDTSWIRNRRESRSLAPLLLFVSPHKYLSVFIRPRGSVIN